MAAYLIGFGIFVVLTTVVLIIVHALIQDAIDSSDLAKDIREIKQSMLRRAAGDAAGDISSLRDPTHQDVEGTCPACGSWVTPADAECPSCGLTLIAKEDEDAPLDR